MPLHHRAAGYAIARMTTSWSGHRVSCVSVIPFIYSSLLIARVAEVHEFPDRLVLVRLDRFAAAMVRHLNVAGEPKVCAVEVRESCGDMLDTLDVVDHPAQRQIASASEGHSVSVVAVLIDVPGGCRDGFSRG